MRLLIGSGILVSLALTTACTFVTQSAIEERKACLDIDGDGSPQEYGSTTCTAEDIAALGLVTTVVDCDDNDPLRAPQFEEIAYDGIDNDCDENRADILDVDGDGSFSAPDERLDSVEVVLLASATSVVVQSEETDSAGVFIFEEVPVGEDVERLGRDRCRQLHRRIGPLRLCQQLYGVEQVANGHSLALGWCEPGQLAIAVDKLQQAAGATLNGRNGVPGVVQVRRKRRIPAGFIDGIVNKV